jgi:hypothetical protein
VDEQTRLEARDLLLKSRIFRIIGIFFAIGGILLFIVLYLRFIEGDIVRALHSPAIIAIMIIPFLPAIIFAAMASRSEKKLKEILEKEDFESKKTTS